MSKRKQTLVARAAAAGCFLLFLAVIQLTIMLKDDATARRSIIAGRFEGIYVPIIPAEETGKDDSAAAMFRHIAEKEEADKIPAPVSVKESAERREAKINAEQIEIPGYSASAADYYGKTYDTSDWNVLRVYRTHYCPESCCNGSNSWTTATGAEMAVGKTIAVNPDYIPYGAYVEIDGHVYRAEDTGNMDGPWIDLLVEDHETARQLGAGYITVRWARNADPSEVSDA